MQSGAGTGEGPQRSSSGAAAMACFCVGGD